MSDTQITNKLATKWVAVLGDPVRDVEEQFPDAQVDWKDGLEDIVLSGDLDDEKEAVNSILAYAQAGGKLYLAKSVSGATARVLEAVAKVRPGFVIDEALDVLHAQVEGDPILAPEDFEQAVLDGAERGDMLESMVEVTLGDEDGEVLFFEAGRQNSPQRIVFGPDGVIMLNGAVLRNVAIIGAGHFHRELLGKRILTPGEVLRFIANRVAVNGPSELCGYGRAFGPSRDDVTNATLTPRSRLFRAHGLTGVVEASLRAVTKAKSDMVADTGKMLRQQLTAAAKDAIKSLLADGLIGRENDLNTLARMGDERAIAVLDTYVAMHQQAKELYVGVAAVIAFRHTCWLDAQGHLVVEAYGKSSKHWRVDAGAYCLYTEAGDGYVTLPALLGQFEESNDGSIYAPLALMNTVRGYLKESVVARKDTKSMSDEVLARFEPTMVAVEGMTIQPGDVVFTVGTGDDVEAFTWETKADYGIVRKVVADIDFDGSKFARFEVRIDAYFESDMKLRGFGKGLVCPAEAAGVQTRVYADGVELPGDRLLIGVPGIVKDSQAALEYASDPRPVCAMVTTQHCRQSFEAAKQKHCPDQTFAAYEDDENPPVVYREYPGGVRLVFDERDRFKLTITTIDPNAIACDIRCNIEASPVAQSVGSSGMTMPQIGFLSSFESGNRWLCDQLLPGVQKRVRTLAYFHALAGCVDMNEGLADDEAEQATDDDITLDLDELYTDEVSAEELLAASRNAAAMLDDNDTVSV